MRIGYARVSTDDQTVDNQVLALEQAGCERIFTDQGVSGAAAWKPELQQALNQMRAGDVLVVTRLDRLDRSLVMLIETINRLARDQVGFLSLSEAIDTTSPAGELVFHIFAALAQFERGVIAERTKAGVARARKAGKTIGRPPTITDATWADMKKRLDNGEKVYQLAKVYNVSPQAIYRRRRGSSSSTQ